jgi:hypothetical protein
VFTLEPRISNPEREGNLFDRLKLETRILSAPHQSLLGEFDFTYMLSAIGENFA